MNSQHSFPDEERLDVPLVQVLGHVLRDYRLAGFEHLQVAFAHLGRDLVADVQQLPKAGVVPPVLRVVAERARELLGRPAPHLFLRGQLRAVYVNHRRVRRAQGFDVVERHGVNLLGERETFAAALGEADDLFEPGRAGGLHVDAGPGARERLADRRVDGELVAAGVDAQLEVVGEIITAHGVSDDGDVFIKLLLELRHVADVVNALVEAAGELRRDGLGRNLLIRNRGEDDEEFGWRLRAVGLVHRDLRDEVALALQLRDVAVDAPGVPDGLEVLRGDALDLGARRLERLRDAGNLKAADEFGVALDESPHSARVG